MTDLNDKAKRLELVQHYLNAETTIEEEQLLLEYYTHSEEELSPEEEDVRLLLMATNAHSHQEELSIQKEKEFDQLMQPFYQQDKKPRSRSQWLYPVIGAVAASLLLLLLLHHPTADTEQAKVAHQLVEKQPTNQSVKNQPTHQQPAPSQEKESSPVEKLTPETSEVKLTPEPPKQLAQHHEKAGQETPIPDTLGNGIWKSEKNVLTALKMLADCEATIQREEQEVRNDIIQATFRATPQPAGVRLVSNEAGDYEVIDPKSIIDI